MVVMGALVLLAMGINSPGRDAYLAITGAILLAGAMIASAIRGTRPSAGEPRRGV